MVKKNKLVVDGTTYIYEVSDVKRPLKFFVFADLHMNKDIDLNILSSLVDAAKDAQPDAVIFLGDLIHTVQYLDDEKNFTTLKKFLDDLAEVAPFYIIVGNHDIRSYDTENDRAFVREPREFWEAVTKNPKIKLLRNQEIETPDYYIAGMEQSAECYGLNRDGGLNKYQRNILFAERPEAMRKELKIFLDNLNIPKIHDKPNILLLHSARFLGWRNMKRWVTDFDVIMSGHLHNMAMPDKAFKKTMQAYGLGKKKGHFVCPPVSVFVKKRYQNRFRRRYAIVKIVKKQASAIIDS